MNPFLQGPDYLRMIVILIRTTGKHFSGSGSTLCEQECPEADVVGARLGVAFNARQASLRGTSLGKKPGITWTPTPQRPLLRKPYVNRSVKPEPGKADNATQKIERHQLLPCLVCTEIRLAFACGPRTSRSHTGGLHE